MSVKLYEGAWGVTRNGRVLGPMAEDQGHTLPQHFKWKCGSHSWKADGGFAFAPSPVDIVAVFPDRETAEASLAEKKPAPRHCAAPAPADPTPVTWPDGVDEMKLCGGSVVKICNGGTRVGLAGSDGAYNDAAIRQLAALIVAAADYIEENNNA